MASLCATAFSPRSLSQVCQLWNPSFRACLLNSSRCFRLSLMPYGFCFSAGSLLGRPRTRVRISPVFLSFAWRRRRLCSSGIGIGFDQPVCASFLSRSRPSRDDADSVWSERVDDRKEFSLVVFGCDFESFFSKVGLRLEEGRAFLDDGAFGFFETDAFFSLISFVFFFIPFNRIGHPSSWALIFSVATENNISHLALQPQKIQGKQ